MAEEFFIPKLGQTVEEVTLVNWLVEDGAKVSQGQPIMEVETDKAVFPVEANARGVIHIGPYKQGDVLPVLAVVAIIGKPDDRFEAGGIVSGAPASETVPADSAIPAAGPSALPAAKAENEKPFASPRARKLAGEKNVDLAAVSPTGYGGVWPNGMCCPSWPRRPGSPRWRSAWPRRLALTCGPFQAPARVAALSRMTLRARHNPQSKLPNPQLSINNLKFLSVFR